MSHGLQGDGVAIAGLERRDRNCVEPRGLIRVADRRRHLIHVDNDVRSGVLLDDLIGDGAVVEFDRQRGAVDGRRGEGVGGAHREITSQRGELVAGSDQGNQ